MDPAAELIFTALAELSTRQIAETMDAVGMDENKVAGKKGGGIAKKARSELEANTGKRLLQERASFRRDQKRRCQHPKKNHEIAHGLCGFGGFLSKS